ncbi:MAG: hypothetical protein NTZ33_14115 [Bacteroidetes bacterium]|nr:hypothetical protein [Bacteroidota bacterium]
MKLTNFKLDKLYLDCIDKDGNCFIVYWANLKFSFLKISYSGLIFSDVNCVSVEKSSLRKIPEPLINDKLQFNNPKLQLKGNWEKIDTPVSLLLYTDPSGKELYWNCHHPKTLTNIIYKDKQYEGLGYAETLSLHFKPWQLPIDELRWGRYLSEKNTIIWINWKGKYPLNKIICNGVIYEDAVFEQQKICFDKAQSILFFEELCLLRKGKLSNILAKMPWLKLIFKSRMLNTIEIKYKARTSLIIDLNPVDKGWSLFEIVSLNK